MGGDFKCLLNLPPACLSAATDVLQLMQEVGGQDQVHVLLRGQWQLSGLSYEARVKAVEQRLQTHPMDAAYTHAG